MQGSQRDRGGGSRRVLAQVRGSLSLALSLSPSLAWQTSQSSSPLLGLLRFERHERLTLLSRMRRFAPDSESSMFVWPHKLILKTCGTTTLLLGIPTLLRIASETCGFKGVWRCFYSRKTFMFPDRQRGPHKDWNAEMAFLDKLFGTSASASPSTIRNGRTRFPICWF